MSSSSGGAAGPATAFPTPDAVASQSNQRRMNGRRAHNPPAPTPPSLSPSEIRLKAKESVINDTLRVGGTVSALALLDKARTEVRAAGELEARGEMKAAFAGYVRVVALVMLALEAPEAADRDGEVRRELGGFLKNDNCDINERVRVVREKLEPKPETKNSKGKAKETHAPARIESNLQEIQDGARSRSSSPVEEDTEAPVSPNNVIDIDAEEPSARIHQLPTGGGIGGSGTPVQPAHDAASSASSPPTVPNPAKTPATPTTASVCRYWKKNGRCLNGSKCKFSHDLQIKVDNPGAAVASTSNAATIQDDSTSAKPARSRRRKGRANGEQAQAQAETGRRAGEEAKRLAQERVAKEKLDRENKERARAEEEKLRKEKEEREEMERREREKERRLREEGRKRKAKEERLRKEEGERREREQEEREQEEGERRKKEERERKVKEERERKAQEERERRDITERLERIARERAAREEREQKRRQQREREALEKAEREQRELRQRRDAEAQARLIQKQKEREADERRQAYLAEQSKLARIEELKRAHEAEQARLRNEERLRHARERVALDVARREEQARLVRREQEAAAAAAKARAQKIERERQVPEALRARTSPVSVSVGPSGCQHREGQASWFTQHDRLAQRSQHMPVTSHGTQNVQVVAELGQSTSPREMRATPRPQYSAQAELESLMTGFQAAQGQVPEDPSTRIGDEQKQPEEESGEWKSCVVV